MADSASLWFHYCAASGWFRAERTGLSAKATRSRGSRGQLEFKEGRRDLAIQDLRAFQRRILDGRKDALPRRMKSAPAESDHCGAGLRLEGGSFVRGQRCSQFVRSPPKLSIWTWMERPEVVRGDSDLRRYGLSRGHGVLGEGGLESDPPLLPEE
jgi:hypothetical protein